MNKLTVILVFVFMLAGNSYAFTDAEKLKNSGMAYYQAAMYEKAAEKFSKSIDLEPSYGAYLYRGQAYCFIKLYDQAISDFTEAIHINSNDVAAYAERGNAYALKGWYNQAFYDLNQAISMKPDDGLSYLYRAKAYYETQEYKLAWTDLKQAKVFGQPVSDEVMELYQRKALKVPAKKKSFFSF
ncbi:MAG TPA: hypothetical protein PL125_00195 [Candidatus Omnitrophota bacterium]|nr:hypothetical protein [Candidatus Omnitrophota bacterium]HPT38608.1 hypothetical protein [Candidatus Omnitrophota bacterium]